MSVWAALLLMHLSAPAPTSGGLGGLGPPGGLLRVDTRAQTLEVELLQTLNTRRSQAHQTPLSMDETLRRFARHEAELAANGNTSIDAAEAAIKAQNLAPLGHRLQFAYGTNANTVLASLKDAVKTLVHADLTRLGAGAFVVGESPLAFEVVLLAVQDPDPMQGKPGLSAAQTDSVMQAASPKLIACYNVALRNNPNLRGDILLQVIIGAEGAVDQAKLVQGTHQMGLDSCLLGVAQGLSFPQPYKGKQVTLLHPVRLTPPQGDRKLGQLSPDQIRSGFAIASDDFRQCYTARLQEVPTLVGTVTLAGVIGPDGGIKSLDVLHNDTGDAPLQSCVLTRAKQLHFATPAQGGEVDITYPLRFGL